MQNTCIQPRDLKRPQNTQLCKINEVERNTIMNIKDIKDNQTHIMGCLLTTADNYRPQKRQRAVEEKDRGTPRDPERSQEARHTAKDSKIPRKFRNCQRTTKYAKWKEYWSTIKVPVVHKTHKTATGRQIRPASGFYGLLPHSKPQRDCEKCTFAKCSFLVMSHHRKTHFPERHISHNRKPGLIYFYFCFMFLLFISFFVYTFRFLFYFTYYFCVDFNDFHYFTPW